MKPKRTSRCALPVSDQSPCVNGGCDAASSAPTGRGFPRSSLGSSSRSKSRSTLKLKDVFVRVLSPLAICLVTWSLRIVHVVDPGNWWSLHPDEVYQSVEIGHIEAFGYGFRSFEFSPPDESVTNGTFYSKLLQDAGLSTLRSPIFPYFYALVFFFSFHLGISCNPYVVARIAHVSLTSLLPAAVYHYVKQLANSRDKALMAAILTASSVHMHVFGTRCLMQSFLAPMTFTSLALTFVVTRTSSSGIHENVDANGNVRLSHNDVVGVKENFTHQQRLTQKSRCSGEVVTKRRTHSSTADSQSQSENVVSNGNSRQLKKHQNNYQHLAVLKLNGFVTPTKECLVLGFLIGLTCYIRCDVILVHVINFVVLLPRPRKKRLLALSTRISIGLVLSLLGALLADRMYYGSWVVSPYNWMKANVVSDLSTWIFGKMPGSFYVYNFIDQDFTTSALCLISIISLVALSIKERQVKSSRDRTPYTDEGNESSLKKCFQLFLGWAVLLLIYSSHGHKEVRFIHDVVVFILIFISCAVCHFIDAIESRLEIKLDRVKVLFILILLPLQWHHYPSPHKSHAWAFQNAEDTQSLNACLHFVSQQNDARGVFLDSNFFMAGGMTLLHHDIPVLSLLVNGFFEFGFDSRLNSSSSNPVFPVHKTNSDKSNLVRDHTRTTPTSSQYSINAFTRASNYVSHTNAPAVIRIIVENKNYNYVILRKDRRFLEIGFEEVFQTGNQRVLRRTLEATSELQLDRFLQKIPLGSNATVLLHEGDVLSSMGRCREAVQRLEASVAIQPSLVEAYLPMYHCLLELGRKQEASMSLATCFKMASEQECTAARPLTRLY